MAERVALTGVRLIDGSGRDPVDDAVLVMEGPTIVAAGAAIEVRLDPDATVVDASGATVMPGIIDAHCHLGGNSHPDEDSWVLQPDRYQAIASVAQARALLRHGVTSVRDISVNGTHLRQAIADGLIEGPRIVPCWRGLSRRGGHGDANGVPVELVRTSHPWGIVADGADEVRRATREVIRNGSRCIKVWASGGGLSENDPEDAQHFSLEELRVIVEEANYVHLPVAAHCECRSAARSAVEAGVWSIEHGEDLDEETVELMAAKHISLNPTLVLLTKWAALSKDYGGHYGKPYIPGGGPVTEDREGMLALLHDRLSSNLLAARDAGVRIGVGSDSFSTELTPYGEQTLEEVRALVAAGMTEMEALVAATRSGAEILRIDEATGTLEAGKSADILVLDGDPLDDISVISPESMLLVVKEGVVVRNSLFEAAGSAWGRAEVGEATAAL